MGDKENLISMGFSEAKVAKALKVNGGLQPALDWLVAHADEPDPVDDGSEGASQDVVVEGEVEAKSIKCTECGKIFKNTALASYHGEKSGHSAFEESTEEIKPLTEEERLQKLEELKAKMAAKRRAQAKLDEEERRRNDEIRRKSGKEQQAYLAELKVKEAQKEAEQRRKEKLADKKAKAAILAQIEADKKERAAKAARDKALREGKTFDVSAAVEVAAAPVAKAPTSTKEYTQTRLQIRLPPGAEPLVHAFPVTSPLSDVIAYISENANLTTFTIACSFPRKTYGPDDYSKTLSELELVPSAVLLVQ